MEITNINPHVATVEVIREGPHGPYAVTTSREFEGSITFSLEKSVWKENALPEKGSFVVLDDLRRKRQGWRAHSARFYRHSDEQSANIRIN